MNVGGGKPPPEGTKLRSTHFIGNHFTDKEARRNERNL